MTAASGAGRPPVRRAGALGLELPVRGAAVRSLGLPLPVPGQPAAGTGAPRMPLLHGRRPLKRWRYVAAFGPELMLCAGDARIGPLRQRWWAVAEPGKALVERTSLGSAGISLDRVATRVPGRTHGVTVSELSIAAGTLEVRLRLDEGGVEPVEVVSRSREGWIWTRKQAGVPARGTVALDGRARDVELEAVIDDSAGYHERHTAWFWSTGVGRADSGERIGWNLVAGVHDAPSASERALWVDGRAAEVGPAEFARDLSSVAFGDGGSLRFTPWAAREHRTNLLLLRSAYRQPFGTFTGELPGGLRLAEGYGVMEEHDVWW